MVVTGLKSPKVSVIYGETARLNPKRDERVARFFRDLPRAQREAVLRFRRIEDRNRKILGLWLLEELLAMMAPDVHVGEDLLYLETGKPYLRKMRDLDFSISHSGGYAIVAGTLGSRVGIDLEEHREINPLEFERVFPPGVLDRILSSGDARRAFFSFWTIGESVLKAEGKGLAASMREIDFVGDYAFLQGRKWWVTELSIDANYSCHLATEGPAAEVYENRHVS